MSAIFEWIINKYSPNLFGCLAFILLASQAARVKLGTTLEALFIDSFFFKYAGLYLYQIIYFIEALDIYEAFGLLINVVNGRDFSVLLVGKCGWNNLEFDALYWTQDWSMDSMEGKPQTPLWWRRASQSWIEAGSFWWIWTEAHNGRHFAVFAFLK